MSPMTRQRSRVRLHPLAEAGARIAYAWLRNQRSFRDRRPLVEYVRKTARFFGLRDQQQTVEVEMAGLRVLVSTSDGTIARSVYASGDIRYPLMVGVVFDALDAYGQAYRGKTFVEVGANFGVYSLPAVSKHGFGSAIGYEPDPNTFELLQRNIERNALSQKVSAINAALSAEAGTSTLQLGTHNAAITASSTARPARHVCRRSGSDVRRGGSRRAHPARRCRPRMDRCPGPRARGPAGRAIAARRRRAAGHRVRQCDGRSRASQRAG